MCTKICDCEKDSSGTIFLWNKILGEQSLLSSFFGNETFGNILGIFYSTNWAFVYQNKGLRMKLLGILHDFRIFCLLRKDPFSGPCGRLKKSLENLLHKKFKCKLYVKLHGAL